MMPQFPSTWQRFFAQPAASIPPVAAGQPPIPSFVPVRRLYGGYTIGSPTNAAGAAPPVEMRPTPPEPPRRALELAWLTCQMPEHMREPAAENLRQTLNWRAQHCKPLKAPKRLVVWTRFGPRGERLWPRRALTVRKLLQREARESIRLLEGTQPHLERNHLLAMRGARLGQLCMDLEERGIDPLETLRWELTALWE
jgi:hypothetical protein